MSNGLVDVKTGEVLPAPDPRAVAIGSDISAAKGSLVDSVKHSIRAGQRLAEVKASLPHGEWLPWLKAHADVLGFESRQAASRLMRLADGAPAHHLEHDEAVALSRETWGHTKAHVSNNSGEDEWYTPPDILDAARAVMGGIDLDPASNALANKHVQAERYFTQRDNGLTQTWHGRVWLNPPYSQPLIEHFAQKVVDSYPDIDQACVLVNNATDTAWGQQLLEQADAWCFLRGRVKFIDKQGNPSGAPLQGQMVLYYGRRVATFAKWFSGLGVVR